MNKTLGEHPAVQFGEWLRSKRKEKDIVARVFAGRIQLSPAQYAEVEAGIVHWLNEKQESLVTIMLDLQDDELAEFSHKLFLAKEAPSLKFDDVFTHEQLEPARCSTKENEVITDEKRIAILKAVFTPLEAD